MNGPGIEFCPGRTDADVGTGASVCPFASRFPRDNYTAPLLRHVFGRMGFDDTEIVALIGGGHSTGYTHTRISGFPTLSWDGTPFILDSRCDTGLNISVH